MAGDRAAGESRAALRAATGTAATAADAARAGSGVSPAAPPDLAGGVTTAMRLQILAAEHSSLVATRSLSWNESFSRASMFLSTLSGAIVALALVGQGTGFKDPFGLFGIVILPVVLFVGVATFVRMGAANYYDAQCVIGMNRIRAGYLEIAPDLERFFVMSAHDDVPGVGVTMGLSQGGSSLVHLIAATPMLISVVDSVLAAAIVGLVALLLGVPTAAILALGAVAFAFSLVAHGAYGRRAITRGRASSHSLFPTPPSDA